MRARDLERRVRDIERGRGGQGGLVFFTNGTTRAVTCADPCLLFCALGERLWYGRGNVPAEQEGEKRYGWLLDILQGENVESFKSADTFFENVANQVIFETKKGGIPLCQRKNETQVHFNQD